MPDTQIRMRFSATGLKQIRDDLKSAGQDGTSAMRKISDAIENPNKALGMTERELHQVRASQPTLDAELRALWLAKRQVDVDASFTPKKPAVPTEAAVPDGSVPTFSADFKAGGNASFLIYNNRLPDAFPLFPPFPPSRKRETGENWKEWSEQCLRWEERAAILEHTAGLTKREAERLATELEGDPRAV